MRSGVSLNYVLLVFNTNSVSLLDHVSFACGASTLFFMFPDGCGRWCPLLLRWLYVQNFCAVRYYTRAIVVARGSTVLFKEKSERI